MGEESRGGFADKFKLLAYAATDHGITKADVAVLAVITWRFNRNHGCCWPSIARLAEDAKLNERTVKRSLTNLEVAGYIRIVRNRGALNRYVVKFDGGGPQTPRSDQGSTSPVGWSTDPPTSDIPVPKGGVHRPPEYLKELVKESLKGKGLTADFSEKGKSQGKSVPGGGRPEVEVPGWSGARAEKRSPEEQAKAERKILNSRWDLRLIEAGKYQHLVAGIALRYRNACEEAGVTPDQEVLDWAHADPPQREAA